MKSHLKNISFIISRCQVGRQEWKYTEEKHFSLVTEFDLDCEQKSIVTLIMAIFFIGWGIGAIVSGSIADRYGRRVVFCPSLATIYLLGFASPFVGNVHVVVAFRFLIGFAFPSVLIQSSVFLTEFVGGSFRHIYLAIPVGSANIAWIILGVKAFYIQNWRYLSIVCTAPYVFTLLFHFFIPESARWLHSRNRNKEALDVLRYIAKWNKQTLPADVTLSSNQSTVTVYRPKTNPFNLIKTRRLALRTGAMMLVWLSTALQTYGLQFAAKGLGGTVYINFMVLSAAGLPGSIAAAIGVKVLGRKIATLTPIAVGALMCFVIAALPRTETYNIGRLVLGIFGKLCGIAQFSCLYTWSPEMFSTNMRAGAMGVFQLSARVGAGLSPIVVIELARLGEWIPFVFLGVASLVAVSLGLVLPETIGKELKDDEPE